MPELTSEQITRLIESCRAHLTEMADSFRTSFAANLRFAISGEPRPFAAEALTAIFDGPGLAVSFAFAGQGLILLIPESLPLPDWYRGTGITENNRLQTFAHELSMQLLPADLQADRYAAMPEANLKAFVERAQPGDWTQIVELGAFDADAAEGEAPLAKLVALIPVGAPPIPAHREVIAADESEVATESPGDSTRDEPQAATDEGSSESAWMEQALSEALAAESEPAIDTASASAASDAALRALRIMNVPVTVSVRLAERKVPMGQVVGFVPGSLVTFNKSCEELLDLFVNNHRYCQGEAVKIGENFGLKVARVGVAEQRKERVL